MSDTAEQPDNVDSEELENEEIETDQDEAIETEEEGQEETSEDEHPDYEDVDYEGKQYKLPKELKEALLRQADYTRKTQEVAEQRKAVEVERENANIALQLMSTFQKEYAELNNVDKQLEELRQIDWNQAVEIDSQAAMKLQFKYNQLLQQRGELVNNIQQVQSDTEARQQQAHQEMLRKGIEECKRIIPGFGTPEVANKIISTAEWLGFAKEELANVTDPRAMKAIYLLSSLKESQEKLQKKAPQAPVKPTSTVKAGAGPVTKNPDNMSTDEWLKWRNAEIAKARKQNR